MKPSEAIEILKGLPGDMEVNLNISAPQIRGGYTPQSKSRFNEYSSSDITCQPGGSCAGESQSERFGS